MTRDYSNGKIYEITSESSGLRYIGSTIQSLSMRMVGHRRDYNAWISRKVKNTTACHVLCHSDAKINLIKKFPCKNVKELNKEEGKYINDLECVNRIHIGRTNKEYRKIHKEVISERKKIYYQLNKKKINQERKKYQQEYRKINEQSRICTQCKSKYTISNYARHCKSKKHLNSQ